MLPLWAEPQHLSLGGAGPGSVPAGSPVGSPCTDPHPIEVVPWVYVNLHCKTKEFSHCQCGVVHVDECCADLCREVVMGTMGLSGWGGSACHRAHLSVSDGAGQCNVCHSIGASLLRGAGGGVRERDGGFVMVFVCVCDGVCLSFSLSL